MLTHETSTYSICESDHMTYHEIATEIGIYYFNFSLFVNSSELSTSAS